MGSEEVELGRGSFELWCGYYRGFSYRLGSFGFEGGFFLVVLNWNRGSSGDGGAVFFRVIREFCRFVWGVTRGWG